MKTERPFTGSGWSFPPTFDKAEQTVLLTSDAEDIKKSLEILLGTIKGERIMQPSFGCNLDEMVFESFNLTMKNYLIDLIKTAILYHEARIDPIQISIDESFITEGRVMIHIDYNIRSSNSRFNMVYPFYLNEASEITKPIATNAL